jgi:hypothetical protein
VAGSLRVRFPRALARADVVLSVLSVVSVVAIVGVAVGVLRLQCLGGACFSVIDPLVTSSIEAQAAAEMPSAGPAAALTAPEPVEAVSAPFAEGLIAGTFEMLESMPQPPMAPRPLAAAQAVAGQTATTERVAYAAVARAVSATPEESDDLTRWWWPGNAAPAFPTPAPFPAEGSVPEIVAAVPEIVAAVPEPETSPEPAVVETPPADAAGPDTRIVAGAGVNVRSGPSKSSGVEFALSGGVEVTLTGAASQGWLELRDARGRTGWAYEDYLLRH